MLLVPGRKTQEEISRAPRMNTPEKIAKHIREVHLGGNWTESSLKDQLKEVTWEAAITQVGDLNSIAKLVFHLNYFVAGVIPVFHGGKLDINDKYSFDAPSVSTEDEWQQLVRKALDDAETLASLVEVLSEEAMNEPFANATFGTNHRNLLGIIEHTHYHLGQIALLKKMIPASKSS